ncbi:unnamed protein product, partial [Symbiodinium natans]
MSSSGSSSSSSSDSSRSSSSDSSRCAAPPDSCDASIDVSSEQEDLFAEEDDATSDEEPKRVDVFQDVVSATQKTKYQGSVVHFWTFPRTDKEGAVTATSYGKKHLAKMNGPGSVEYYVIVAEEHQGSERSWERTKHWHAVLKLSRRIKWKALARRLRAKGLYGHLALPRMHADFFRCLRYLLAPTPRKGQQQLDENPYFSSAFPMDMMEKRMKKFMNVSVRPSDVCSIVRRMKFTRFQELVDWCKAQRKRGNGVYEAFLAKQGQKMPGLFASWQQILCEPAAAAGLRLQRMQMWEAAAQSPCVCVSPDRLQTALDQLLDHHK